MAICIGGIRAGCRFVSQFRVILSCGRNENGLPIEKMGRPIYVRDLEPYDSSVILSAPVVGNPLGFSGTMMSKPVRGHRFGWIVCAAVLAGSGFMPAAGQPVSAVPAPAGLQAGENSSNSDGQKSNNVNTSGNSGSSSNVTDNSDDAPPATGQAVPAAERRDLEALRLLRSRSRRSIRRTGSI